jgi:hypothetical protein
MLPAAPVTATEIGANMVASNINMGAGMQRWCVTAGHSITCSCALWKVWRPTTRGVSQVFHVYILSYMDMHNSLCSTISVDVQAIIVSRHRTNVYHRKCSKLSDITVQVPFYSVLGVHVLVFWIPFDTTCQFKDGAVTPSPLSVENLFFSTQPSKQIQLNLEPISTFQSYSLLCIKVLVYKWMCIWWLLSRTINRIDWGKEGVPWQMYFQHRCRSYLVRNWRIDVTS